MSAITEVTHDSRTLSEFSKKLDMTTTPMSNAGSSSGQKIGEISYSQASQSNLEYNDQRQSSHSLENKGNDDNKFFMTMNIDKIEEENESSNNFETDGQQTEGLQSTRQSEFQNGPTSPNK